MRDFLLCVPRDASAARPAPNALEALDDQAEVLTEPKIEQHRGCRPTAGLAFLGGAARGTDSCHVQRRRVSSEHALDFTRKPERRLHKWCRDLARRQQDLARKISESKPRP